MPIVTRRVGSSVAIIAAVAIGLLGSVLATPHGLGVTPDSLIYLQAADSLRHGTGFRVPADDGLLHPLTHYPPLYPASIAFVSLVGSDLLIAARALALALVAANIAAVSLATFCFTRSKVSAAVAAFIVALSVDMLLLNTALWSEAQFILLTVVSLLFAALYLQGLGSRYLALSAVTAALAWLARYAGGATVAAVALAILLVGPRPRVRRFADMLMFSVVASAPAILWMVRNTLEGGTATNRSAALLVSPFDNIGGLVQTVASWLVPGTNRIVVFRGQDVVMTLGIVLAGGALGYAVLRWIRPVTTNRSALARTPIVFLLFAFVYIASVVVGASLFDAGIPMDNRILAPAYVAMIIVTVYVGQIVWKTVHSRTVRMCGVALLAAFLVLNGAVSGVAATHFRREGRGFTGPAWQYPSLRGALAEVPAEVRIFSNHPAAVEYRFGRRALTVSSEALADAVTGHGRAILVYFDAPRAYAPRHPNADKQATSTSEFRVALLEHFMVTTLAVERNGGIFDIRASTAASRARE